MDHLREGINLRAFAQKDPLVEYKKETFHLFESLNLSIAGEVIEKFFKIQVSANADFERRERRQDLIYNDTELPSFNPPPQAPKERVLNRQERRKQSQKKHRNQNLNELPGLRSRNQSFNSSFWRALL